MTPKENSAVIQEPYGLMMQNVYSIYWMHQNVLSFHKWAGLKIIIHNFDQM